MCVSLYAPRPSHLGNPRHNSKFTKVEPRTYKRVTKICPQKGQNGTLEVDVSYGRKFTTGQKEASFETDLDLISHQVVSKITEVFPNEKSLAIELMEAEQALVQQPSLPLSEETPTKTV